MCFSSIQGLPLSDSSEAIEVTQSGSKFQNYFHRAFDCLGVAWLDGRAFRLTMRRVNETGAREFEFHV